MVKNEDVEFIESPILNDKIPKPAPTPQPQLTDSRTKRVNKDLFLSLNDAAKIRDKRTKLSLIAQEYINLAYELGGNSWYGAEEVGVLRISLIINMNYMKMMDNLFL